MTLSIYMFFYRMKTKIAAEYSKLSEKGQGITEYAMILAAVAIIAAVVLFTTGTEGSGNTLKDAIINAFKNARDKVNTVTTHA